MIISHKHKFIFLKTRKTAGTSLEIALSSICGKDDIITPISPIDNQVRLELGYRSSQNRSIPFSKYSKKDYSNFLLKGEKIKFYNHIPAKLIRYYIGEEIWDDYYKFCFERNPFDKVLSFYYWRMRNRKTFMTLSEFINSEYLDILSGFDIYSINGFVAVNQIFKYEELEQSLRKINLKLKLDYPLVLPSYKAKGQSRKDCRHYTEILSLEDKSKIEISFAREMRLLGYRF